MAVAPLLAVCLIMVDARQPSSAEIAPIARLKLENLEGEEIVIGDLLEEGMVLFDFWATWCKPCQLALPEMQRVYEEYHDRGLTVIGISVDGPRNFSKVRPFANRLSLTFPLVLDTTGELQRAFKVTAIPTSILIDSAGVVLKVRQGYRPGEGKEYAKLMEELLPEAPPDSLDAEQEADSTGTSTSSS